MQGKRIASWNDFQLFEQVYRDLEDDNQKISQEAFRKIRSACFKVMGQYPFFRSVLSSLIIKENRNLRYKTMATDGASIHYDPEFVLDQPLDVVTWVIVHEIMHNVLKHFDRKELDADTVTWNMAADYALNQLITYNKSNPSLPPTKADYEAAMGKGGLFPGCGQTKGDDKFENLTAEQIFKILLKNPPVCPQCGKNPCECQKPTPPPRDPDPLQVGDIIYDEKTDEYGVVTSFDEATGEVTLDPMDKDAVREEVKRQYEEKYGTV